MADGKKAPEARIGPFAYVRRYLSCGCGQSLVLPKDPPSLRHYDAICPKCKVVHVVRFWDRAEDTET